MGEDFSELEAVITSVFNKEARSGSDLTALRAALKKAHFPSLICGQTSRDTERGLEAFARTTEKAEISEQARSLAAAIREKRFTAA